MQIGRVTGLPEPSGLGQDGLAGVDVELMVSAVQARQLLDMVDNQGDRFVPVLSVSTPELDGLYRVVSVSADQDPDLGVAGLRRCRVGLVGVMVGRQVANGQLLLRGDNRNRVASVGVWAPLYRAGLPGGVGALTSLNAGPGGWRSGGGLERLASGSFGAGVLAPVAGVANATHGFFNAGFTSPGVVARVAFADLAVSTVTLNAGENSPSTIASDGTDFYVGTGTSPGIVVKVDSTPSRVSALTLNAGENSLRSSVVDGTDGFFGTNTSPGIVVKVDLSTLTRTSALTLNSGENELQCATVDGGYGYFGTGTSPGRVVKVDLAAMTRDSAVTLNSGEAALVSAINDGTHAYFGTNTQPGRVVKVNMASMTRVASLTLPVGFGQCLGAVRIGGFGYFTTTSGVVKVDLANMTLAGLERFRPNEQAGYGIVSDGTNLLASTFGVPALTTPGRSVKLAVTPQPSGLRGDHVNLIDNTTPLIVNYTTTANRTLSGLTNTSISGGSSPSAGETVLVKNQSTAAQNGVYSAASGSWTRLTDYTLDFELSGLAVNVTTAATADTGVWHIQSIYSDGTDPTTSGRAVTVRRRPGFGLQASANGGPVSMTFDLPLTSFYNAACTITDANGNTITGMRAPAGTEVRIDNGLVRVRRDNGQLLFEFVEPGDTTWTNVYTVNDDFGGVGSIQALYEPSIITNSPEECALRYRFDTGSSSGTLDVSVLRGIRTATLAVTHATPRLSRLTFLDATGSTVTMDDLTGTGTGYTGSPTRHILYEAADNTAGNRVGASYSGALDSNDISTVARRTHVWGVHAVINGGSASTLVDGIYGMDRTFYGMLSSQQSAGVV